MCRYLHRATNSSFFVEWNIYLTNFPNLNFAVTPSYSITIECQDDALKSDTMVLDVGVNENSAPVISDLPSSESVTEGQAPGNIYDMVVTDADPYTCAIQTMAPAGGPFDIQVDAGTTGVLCTIISFIPIIVLSSIGSRIYGVMEKHRL